MQKTIIWIVVILLIIWGIMAVVGGEDTPDTETGEAVWPEEGESIKLGFIGPLTGDLAALGANALTAAEIAVDEVNEAGGVNGFQIELLVEDGACSGKEANAAANKLINADGVHAIAGGLCSPETLSFTDLANQTMTPMVSPCSSAPAVTDAGDYVFRVYPSDSYQGSFAAEYFFNTLGIKKAAVLYTNDDWGLGIQETFKTKFEELGGEILATESFGKDSRDLRTQIAKIKDVSPEGIYFPGFTEASIPGIKQIAEAGLDVPVMGGDAWGDPTIWSEVGEAGEGFLWTEVTVPENEEYVTKMADRDAEPTACSHHAYDAIKVYALALEEGGIDGESLKNSLYSTVLSGGVSGDKVEFDENGDLVGAGYTVKKNVGGEAVVQ